MPRFSPSCARRSRDWRGWERRGRERTERTERCGYTCPTVLSVLSVLSVLPPAFSTPTRPPIFEPLAERDGHGAPQGVPRKVRAPAGRLPGNAWAPKGDGLGHR